jgi:hypothetical protein
MRSEPAEGAAAAVAMATSSQTTELGGCWVQNEGTEEPYSGDRRSRSARRSRRISNVSPELDLTQFSSVSNLHYSSLHSFWTLTWLESPVC